MEYVSMMAFITSFTFLKFSSAFADAALIANTRSTSGIDGRNRSVEKIGSMI